MEKKEKIKNGKKWLVLAGGFVLAISVITPLAYFLSKTKLSNPEFKTKQAKNFWVENNALVLKFEQNYSNINNDDLTLKYWSNTNPQIVKSLPILITPEEKLTGILNPKIENLDPNQTYSAQLLNSNGQILQEISNFFVYKNPIFKISSTINSINLQSTYLDYRLGMPTIYASYRETGKSGNTPFIKKLINLKTVKNPSTNQDEYIIDTELTGLKADTGYEVAFFIENNNAPLMKYKTIFTIGEDNLSLVVKAASETTVKLFISNIVKFLNKYQDDPKSLTLRYISTKTGVVSAIPISISKLDEDGINIDLNNLNSGDLYNAYIYDQKTKDEEVVSSKVDFVTNSVPKLQEIYLATKGHKYLNLKNEVIVSFTDFINDYDGSKSLDPTQMLVALWEGESNIDAINPVNIKTFVLPQLVFGFSNVFASELEKGKTYNFNLFDIKDTLFSSPKMKTTSLDSNSIELDVIFPNEKITHNSAEINLTNFPVEYEANELELALFKQNPDGSYSETPNFKTFISELDKTNKTAKVVLNNLDILQTYKIAVWPNYSPIKQLKYNFLEGKTTTFRTKGYLTFDLGDWYNPTSPSNFLSSDTFSFTLSKIDDDFPFGQDLILQWRKKPTDPNIAWNENDAQNSFEFQITNKDNLVNDAKTFSFNRKDKEFWLGEINQIRIFNKNDTQKVNLIKLGNNEFSFNDSLTARLLSETKNIETINLLKNQFQKPAVENIVNQDYQGSNLANAVWQRYRGFEDRKAFVDLYEYLTHSNDEDSINTFADNIKNGFQNYINGGTTYNIDQLFIFTPLDINKYQGDTLFKKAEKIESEGKLDRPWTSPTPKTIEFGGYGPRLFGSEAPIKPSDFINSSFKISSWDAIKLAVKFKFQRLKSTSLTFDNIYLKWDYKNQLTEIVPTFFKANKEYLNEVINLTYPSSITAKYNLTVNSEDDILPNDLTGELGLKVNATPKVVGDQAFSFFIVLKGLKASNENIIAEDVNFNLYPDQVIGKYYFAQQLNKLTDADAKKAFLEKYFKVHKDANVSYTVKNAEVINDKLFINVEITKTTHNWGESTELVKEVAIGISLDYLDQLPVLSQGFPNGSSVTGDNQGVAIPLANISGFAENPTKDGKGYAVNLTYVDFLALMQEAVAKDAAIENSNDAEAKNLAYQIILNSESFPIGNILELGFLYFVPMATTPLVKVTSQGEENKVFNQNFKGFYAPVSTGATEVIEIIEQTLVEMIKKYGKQ
ncbi:hypothetical protein ACW95P_00125 [Candidatus Mycoplasma pogonae]